jgi:transposase
LEARVGELEARLAELETRLRLDSSNSGKAPSSDLFVPTLRQRRPTGRRPGGQAGHEGHHRELLPVEQVDEVVEYRPEVCGRCGLMFSGEVDVTDVPACRHQVTELPVRAVRVVEHRAYRCICPRCGGRTEAEVPRPLIQSCLGPRLAAAVCYLTARVHGSRRAAAEMLGEVLGCELSLGSVSNVEGEMAGALESTYGQIQRQVRSAAVKYVDETGWKGWRRGVGDGGVGGGGTQGRYLWTAATDRAVLLSIQRGRNWQGLQQLLGKQVRGVVISDRCGLYNYLKPARRGVCWAHLKRDFQRQIDHGGKVRFFGEQGMGIVKDLFTQWQAFCAGTLGRVGLKRAAVALRRRMTELIAAGVASGLKKVRRFMKDLDRLGPALWTWACVPGAEPTNNLAERSLRPGVIWRKISFGSVSARGCRYAERMMSVIQTLRQRHANVMAFLTDTLASHRAGLSLPKLPEMR